MDNAKGSARNLTRADHGPEGEHLVALVACRESRRSMTSRMRQAALDPRRTRACSSGAVPTRRSLAGDGASLRQTGVATGDFPQGACKPGAVSTDRPRDDPTDGHSLKPSSKTQLTAGSRRSSGSISARGE